MRILDSWISYEEVAEELNDVIDTLDTHCPSLVMTLPATVADDYERLIGQLTAFREAVMKEWSEVATKAKAAE